MLNRLIATAAVMIAANAAAAGPPPTEYNLIDFGRTGDWSVTDDNCLRTTATEQVIRCTEFVLGALPHRRFTGRWVAFSMSPVEPWVVPAVRIHWYRADGLATTADAAAPRYELTHSVDTWAGRDQYAVLSIWVDVEPAYRQIQAEGGSHVGIQFGAAGDAVECFSSQLGYYYFGEPCPPCISDYDQSGGVDGDDIGVFLVEWERGAPCADIDRSGAVDGTDFSLFFEYWHGGACL